MKKAFKTCSITKDNWFLLHNISVQTKIQASVYDLQTVAYLNTVYMKTQILNSTKSTATEETVLQFTHITKKNYTQNTMKKQAFKHVQSKKPIHFY